MELPSSYVRISIALFLVSTTLFTLGRVSESRRAALANEPEEVESYSAHPSLSHCSETPENLSRSHTMSAAYRGRDYPRAWPLPPLASVHLSHEDSVHWSIDTELGAVEWNATLPSGGAVVYLGPDRRPFTVSIFHQMRCLDILRDDIVDLYSDPSPDAKVKRPRLVQHCMNYLRQTVMCRGDLHLETVRAPMGPQVTVSAVTHSCRDWTAVYQAAEGNYQNFLRRQG